MFRRGGLCTTHNIVGTRGVKQTKSWKQRKNGTFGYITSKRVFYTCMLEGLKKSALETDAASSNSETDGAAVNGTKSNYFSVGLSFNLMNDVTRKDESESPPPD